MESQNSRAMKKILLILILLLQILCAYGQQDQEPTKTAKDYLEERERQNNTGLLLLGSSAALFGGAVGLGAIAYSSDDTFSGVAMLTVLAGSLTAGVASIVYFVKAKESKKKAAALSLKYQNNDLPIGSSPAQKVQFVLSLSVNL